jgi:hypothetical protein
MNTATLATTRFQFSLSSGLLVALQRAMAPAVSGTATGVHALDKGATAWIARPLGRTVTCKTGTLWLTFDNETADVILEAGQSHRCAKAAKLAIHALAAARVSVA